MVEVPDKLATRNCKPGSIVIGCTICFNRDMEKLQKVLKTLDKMDSFSKTKKNMFPLLRDGIRFALQTLEMLQIGMENRDDYLEYFEYKHFRRFSVRDSY